VLTVNPLDARGVRVGPLHGMPIIGHSLCRRARFLSRVVDQFDSAHSVAGISFERQAVARHRLVGSELTGFDDLHELPDQVMIVLPALVVV
jgi:hypothetical protein